MKIIKGDLVKMRRSALVFLTLVSTALYTSGHGDGTHSEQTQDVNFKTTKVSGNVYMLQGRGGNIGAISGPDGLLIIDDDYRNMMFDATFDSRIPM